MSPAVSCNSSTASILAFFYTTAILLTISSIAMASSMGFSWVALALLLFVVVAPTANGDHLSARYYDKTCPNVQSVVRSVMAHKVAGEPRMGPAVLRLFFHDCFVNVCNTWCHVPLPAKL